MIRILLLTTILMSSALPSSAIADKGLELTPFIGYRFGGSFNNEIINRSMDVDEQGSWGLVISAPTASNKGYEILYSHQDSHLIDKNTPEERFDLDIHYLQLVGSVDVNYRYFTAFYNGGLGLTYMNPGQSGFNNETRLSLSLGGGLKWYLTDQVGIRLEIRGYGTLFNTSGSLFCHGGCDLALKSDLFPQFETNLGLIFRF
ncbi:MAG: hypothetical protein P8179_11055 [Candidatus Thiodiazotropha sp.]|jgi:opacity protein-like surface antigen